MKDVLLLTEHRIQCPSCLKIWGWHNDFPQQQCPRCQEISHSPNQFTKVSEPIKLSELLQQLQQAQAELASYKAGETLDGTVMYDYFACAYRLDIEGFLSGKDYARGQTVHVLVMKGGV